MDNTTTQRVKVDFDAIESDQESFNKSAEVKILAHEEILKAILETIETVDFRAIAGSGNDYPPQKHQLVICINELLKKAEEKKLGLTRKDDFIFAFNGAFWKELDRELLKNFLGRVAEKQGVTILEAQTYDFKTKLYLQFLSSAFFEPIKPNTGVTLLNTLNGTIEITKDSQTVRAFKREDFLTYQLPFEYDENATCPMFQKYLDRVLPEKELQNLVSEFFGYVFTKNLKMEKAMLLYGSGANGKSVLFDVVNAVLGEENISNFSLSNLLEEHNRALIANKLLNYGSEIDAAKTKDEFKSLVSCEPIQARLKYGQSFIMKNYAKLAFNCNELPSDFTHQHAYFRRLLIVPFRVTIPEIEQDNTLANKIIKNELAGVFNWIVDGLKRLLKVEKFTKSAIVKQTLETYKKESDSVAMFIDENGYKSNSKNFILLKELYGKYREDCFRDGTKALKKLNFKKRLESLGFPVDVVSNVVRVYLEKSDESDKTDNGLPY